MILRGRNDQFQAVLGEELRERTATLMESMYRDESKKLLESIVKSANTPVSIKVEVPKQAIFEKIIFEKTYQLKDGNIGSLNEEDREMVSKLYKNLNNDNKERMVKLLSESQETFNRVLNLARLENKKQGTKNG
jgi:hypothetical protein